MLAVWLLTCLGWGGEEARLRWGDWTIAGVGEELLAEIQRYK